MKNLPIAILFFLSLFIILVSPFLGANCISPFDIFSSTPDTDILLKLRLPRVIGAYLTGAGLAVSGMVFQAMFRNPLATPFTLGISSGAALGSALYVYFGISFSLISLIGGMLASLLGSFFSMLIVYMITRAKGGFSTSVMLLAGVIISFTFSSIILFIQYLGNVQDAMRIMHWLMGSLAGVGYIQVVDLTFIVLSCSILLYYLTTEMDLFLAGEEFAASRGVNINKSKILFFIYASIMVGIIVSVTGPIGFIGMMVPHITRMLFGYKHTLLLPTTFMLGGMFLVLCDLFSRTVFFPAELPIGIVTAMLGGPFFLWILFKRVKFLY